VTALFINLTGGGDATEATQQDVSSIIDTWLLLRDTELGGERNRVMYVLKSRGTAHSNQVREFVLTPHGVELREVYVGPDGVLTGSMRLAQETRERAAAEFRQRETARKRREIERRRAALEAQIAALRAGFESEESELERLIEDDASVEEALVAGRADMARSRKADAGPNGHEGARSRAQGEVE